jgi:hypothetical protein
LNKVGFIQLSILSGFLGMKALPLSIGWYVDDYRVSKTAVPVPMSGFDLAMCGLGITQFTVHADLSDERMG